MHCVVSLAILTKQSAAARPSDPMSGAGVDLATFWNSSIPATSNARGKMTKAATVFCKRAVKLNLSGFYEKASHSFASWAVVTVGGAVVWLVRRVFTNQKQIELL